ncbi:hypothetical protein [Labedella endophytica]|uniref:DUF3137 domain-containing protein n=1 Tax=Labedella endophytica TaxID=1523160 RepID=A0A433JS53_9MICO|nr:hypothetical protein [Labedella endophytica]RUR01123.1 hypothetical protein ELQ94_06240 [Labedella endophytica]
MSAQPDTTALTAAVSRSEVKDFRRREKSNRRWFDTTNVWVIVIVVIAVLVGGLPLIRFVLGSTDGDAETNAPSVPLAVAGIAGLLIVLVRLHGRSAWAARLRRSRFAEANGLVYDEPADVAEYPGAAFSAGHSQSRDVRFRSVDGPYAEFGTYSWSVGSGKGKRNYRIGFAAMRLEQPLPHMVLDLRDNNGFFGVGIIPFRFDRDQVLSLEGDFDRYFTLYCPSDYERDALYVFTPDVMALLIDESDQFDVEIVDDWVFFYSTRAFDVDEPATWQRLFRIRDTIVAKLHRVSGRYRDDRVPGQDAPVLAPITASATTARRGSGRVRVVAPAGRRLRSSAPWLAVLVLAGIVAIVWFVPQLLM